MSTERARLAVPEMRRGPRDRARRRLTSLPGLTRGRTRAILRMAAQDCQQTHRPMRASTAYRCARGACACLPRMQPACRSLGCIRRERRVVSTCARATPGALAERKTTCPLKQARHGVPASAGICCFARGSSCQAPSPSVAGTASCFAGAPVRFSSPPAVRFSFSVLEANW